MNHLLQIAKNSNINLRVVPCHPYTTSKIEVIVVDKVPLSKIIMPKSIHISFSNFGFQNSHKNMIVAINKILHFFLFNGGIKSPNIPNAESNRDSIHRTTIDLLIPSFSQCSKENLSNHFSDCNN